MDPFVFFRRIFRDYQFVPNLRVGQGCVVSMSVLLSLCLVPASVSQPVQIVELPFARISLFNLESGPVRTITEKVNQEVVLTVPTRHQEAYYFECNASYPVEWNYIGEGNPTAVADVGRYFRDFYDVNSYTYQSILYMHRLDELQSGRYVCRGSNPEFEKSQIHYDLFVPGNRSKIFLSTAEKEIFASELKPLVTLPCSITDPLQIINLYKGTNHGTFQPIQANHSIQFRPRKGFILKLNELSDPFGTYMCTTQDNKIQRKIHLIPERLKAKHDILNSNHLQGKVPVDISYDFEYNRILCCTGGSPYIPKLQWAGCGSVLDCKIKSVCFEEDRCEPRLGDSGSVTHWLDPGPLPRGCAGWKLKNEPNGDYGIFKCSTPGVAQYQPYLLNRGNIFLEFDKAPASETILSLTKTTEEPVVVGNEVEYHCNSTRFYFAYGIRWAFQRGNGDIDFIDESNVVRDRFPPTEHRRQTTFKITHDDIKGIICFVPIANSPTEWRTVSLPITVTGGNHQQLSQLNHESLQNQYINPYNFNQQIEYINNNALGPSPTPMPAEDQYSNNRPQDYFAYQTQDSNSVPKIDISEIVQPEIVFKPSLPVLPTFQPHPLLASSQSPQTPAPLPTYQPHPLLAGSQQVTPLPTYQPHPLLAGIQQSTPHPLPTYQPHPLLAHTEQRPKQQLGSSALYDAHANLYTKSSRLPSNPVGHNFRNSTFQQYLREKETKPNVQNLGGRYDLRNLYEPHGTVRNNQLAYEHTASPSLILKSSPAPHRVTLNNQENSFNERNYDTIGYLNSYNNPRNPTPSAKVRPFFGSYESQSQESGSRPQSSLDLLETPLLENFNLRDIPSPDPQPRIHCDSQGKRCSLRIQPKLTPTPAIPGPDIPDVIVGTRQQSSSNDYHHPTAGSSIETGIRGSSSNNDRTYHQPQTNGYSTLSGTDYYTESLRARERRKQRIKSNNKNLVTSGPRVTSSTTTQNPFVYEDSSNVRQRYHSSQEQEYPWDSDTHSSASSQRITHKNSDATNSDHFSRSNHHHTHRQPESNSNSRKSPKQHNSSPLEITDEDDSYYYQRYAPLELASSKELPAVQFHINLPLESPVIPNGRRISSRNNKAKKPSHLTMQHTSVLRRDKYEADIEDDEEESGGSRRTSQDYLYGSENVPLIELG